ncbi:recombinase family protein [Bifidobacterium asteroides]|uniref:recombinase family protein n=1 Tax=Bifidobacterium asteroides TaxID=1684 RepID=UPI001C6A6A97|nr:recombinase family protein [Bifidobacterium asteroides]QYN59877.1 recombinase family protein [Bifidobacterium asteroides]
MLIGYARVSTTRQAEEGTSLETQTDHLRAAGAERVIKDGGRSGATTDRPGLRELQAAVRPGDVVLVTRLDRLGRSTKDLLEVVERWTDQGVGFRCVDQGLDFSGSSGRFLLTLLGAVAELERSMILERTAAGRAAAKASGKSLGGGTRHWTDRDARKAAGLVHGHSLSTRQAAGAMGVSPRTLRRMLARAQELDGDNGATHTEGAAA